MLMPFVPPPRVRHHPSIASPGRCVSLDFTCSRSTYASTRENWVTRSMFYSPGPRASKNPGDWHTLPPHLDNPLRAQLHRLPMTCAPHERSTRQPISVQLSAPCRCDLSLSPVASHPRMYWPRRGCSTGPVCTECRLCRCSNPAPRSATQPRSLRPCSPCLPCGSTSRVPVGAWRSCSVIPMVARKRGSSRRNGASGAHKKTSSPCASDTALVSEPFTAAAARPPVVVRHRTKSPRLCQRVPPVVACA